MKLIKYDELTARKQLRADVAARTCENFRILCTGEYGKSPVSGYERTFQGWWVALLFHVDTDQDHCLRCVALGLN